MTRYRGVENICKAYNLQFATKNLKEQQQTSNEPRKYKMGKPL